jgi:hypothetical protein
VVKNKKLCGNSKSGFRNHQDAEFLDQINEEE